MSDIDFVKWFKTTRIFAHISIEMRTTDIFMKLSTGEYANTDVKRSFAQFDAGWQAAKQDVGECAWSENEDGQYETSCGGIFELTVDTPEENEFKFCCYCGGVLKQKLFEQLSEQ